MFSLPQRLFGNHALAVLHPTVPRGEPLRQRSGKGQHSLVDLVMPEYHFRGGATVTVEATPGDVLRALDEIMLEDVPLIHALVTLRYLPARVLRRPRPRGEQPDRSLLAMAMPLRLGEDSGREVVVGTAGMLQNPLTLTAVDLPDLFTFTRYNDAASQKLAIGFRVMPDQDGARTIVTAEHRTLALSAAARRRFAVSWHLMLGWGGDLLLRQFLNAVARRAEAGQHAAAVGA